MAGAGFRRPGAVAASAFGFEFNLDREAASAPAVEAAAAAPAPSAHQPVLEHREDLLRKVRPVVCLHQMAPPVCLRLVLHLSQWCKLSGRGKELQAHKCAHACRPVSAHAMELVYYDICVYRWSSTLWSS